MKNQLFYGDNLEVLRKYIKDESVDLCYIDPPFNSDEDYNQTYSTKNQKDYAQSQAFIDTWTWGDASNIGFKEITENNSQAYNKQLAALIIGLDTVLGKNSLLAYLVSMTQRIVKIYHVLKPTGSFYLHCDSAASHYLKLICDCIFIAKKNERTFRNEIIWKRTSAHNDSKQFGRNGDRILFYTKSEKYTFNPIFLEYDQSYLDNFYRYEDEGGKYQLSDLTGAGVTKGKSSQEWNGYNPTERGRHWAIPNWAVEEIIGKEETKNSNVLEKLALLFKHNLIVFSKNGVPRFKRYLSKMEGMLAQEIWTDISPISSQAKERLGYPTQKPEALLERIIKASSKEGDVILDAYCGCGTTIAVAEKLKRTWIGIDITYQSISLILKRLEDSFGIDFTQDIVDKENKKIKVPARLEVTGEPKDFEAAVALANRKDDRLRKEFEKWAVLKFSKNRAFINDKKGGDGGIDGTAYMVDFDENNRQVFKEVIFSVKSNKTLSPTIIRDLFGTIEREKAVIGYLITLYPMPNLAKEAAKYGNYQNKMFGHSYPKIEIVSIQELLDGKRMNLPTAEVLKSAERKNGGEMPTIF